MSIHLTNNLLALGIKPVGSVIGGDVQDFLPHVKDQLDGVVKYGVVADPDMKALLASKPDYIFIDAVYSGDSWTNSRKSRQPSPWTWTKEPGVIICCKWPAMSDAKRKRRAS